MMSDITKIKLHQQHYDDVMIMQVIVSIIVITIPTSSPPGPSHRHDPERYDEHDPVGAHSLGVPVSDGLPGVSDQSGIVSAPSFGTAGVSFGTRRAPGPEADHGVRPKLTIS